MPLNSTHTHIHTHTHTHTHSAHEKVKRGKGLCTAFNKEIGITVIRKFILDLALIRKFILDLQPPIMQQATLQVL